MSRFHAPGGEWRRLIAIHLCTRNAKGCNRRRERMVWSVFPRHGRRFSLIFFMCPFPKDPPHFCVSAQQTPTLYKHTVNPCTVPTIDLPAPPASSSCAHSQHFSAVFVSAMKSIACMGKSYVSLANFQIILLKGGMGGEEELLAVEGAWSQKENNSEKPSLLTPVTRWLGRKICGKRTSWPSSLAQKYVFSITDWTLTLLITRKIFPLLCARISFFLWRNGKVIGRLRKI